MVLDLRKRERNEPLTYFVNKLKNVIFGKMSTQNEKENQYIREHKIDSIRFSTVCLARPIPLCRTGRVWVRARAWIFARYLSVCFEGL